MTIDWSQHTDMGICPIERPEDTGFVDFWSRFDFQYATFNGDGGPRGRATKTFMPSNAIDVRAEGKGPNVGSGVHRGANAVDGAAKLAYGAALYANRKTIASRVCWDLVNKFGSRVERICPPAREGGVLVCYGVELSKTPDGLGTRVASYAHEISLLGAGPDSLAVYRRAMGFGSPPTIGPATKRARVNHRVEKVIQFLWVFRES